jgi:hypothetical protein
MLVILARLLFRRIFASPAVQRSTPVHVTMIMSGWVLRLVAGSPLGVVIADSYAYATHPARGTLTDPFSFEQAADSGSFIDEYTALKEIALAFGRIIFVAALYVLALSTSAGVAFITALIIAACAAGASVILARQHRTSLI